MEKIKKTARVLLPYIVILSLSLAGTYLVFFSGLNKGDDFYYHLPNILDKYNSILNGQSLEISASLAGGLGYGAGLFYSPLSHFTVAFMGVLLHVFGIPLISTYKIVIVLSVFLSGVFTYNFAMKFTGGNKVASVLASACLIIYPYRIFNLFCRVAFAEAFAFTFVPLFFCGVYEITHLNKDEIKIFPFLKLVLGASLLFLSHNLTALFVYIVGFIMFLAYMKNLITLFRVPRYIIYCGVSALLVIGISAVALFSQLELLSMDYYAVSNDVSMRTDVASVLSHVGKEWIYSGFLNIPFLQGMGITFSYLFSGAFVYLFACVIYLIIDTGCAKIAKIKKFRHLISAPSLFILISLISPRAEGYLSAGIFVLLHLVIAFFDEKDEGKKKSASYKSLLLWFSAAVILLAFYLMRNGWVWEIAPGFLRSVQFPWRLWSLVQIFLSILVGLFAAHFAKRKKILALVAVFVGLLMLLNMPLLEKRLASDDRWVDEITEQDIEKSTAIGHQKEYCPQVYRDFEYQPREGSLYYAVRHMLYRNEYDSENKLNPAVLSGKASVMVNSISAPRAEMELVVKEKAEIQLPLLYYPGYKIYVDNGEKSWTITPHEVDGLLSFELEKGEYTVKTDYVGTPIRITGKVLTILSSVAVLLILGYAIYSETRLKDLLKRIKNKNAHI